MTLGMDSAILLFKNQTKIDREEKDDDIYLLSKVYDLSESKTMAG